MYLSQHSTLARRLKDASAAVATLKTWAALRTYALTQLDWNETRRTGRATSWGAAIPWWTYAAIQFVDQELSTADHILELGGGNSTLWWLDRGNTVHTLETSDEWAATLETKIAEMKQTSSITIDVVNGIDCAQLARLESAQFDAVVVDNHGDRSALVTEVLRITRPTGAIIWDNSDRIEYQNAISVLRNNGWDAYEFFGLGPINAFASSTTVLLGPERSARRRGRETEHRYVPN